MFAAVLRFSDRLRNSARRKQWPADLALGRWGEDLAHRFLRAQGFIIVARNYRLSSGAAEADIIARENDDLVFVEVKTRTSDEFGGPERAVGPAKQEHLERAARQYARRADIEWSCVRFDVVTIVATDPPKIQHFRAAWSSD